MKIKIYDYNDSESIVEVPCESVENILTIYVRILSGDETGVILLENGDMIDFDASSTRYIGYDDGDYIVEGTDIEKWINYDKSHATSTISYNRQSFVENGFKYEES